MNDPQDAATPADVDRPLPPDLARQVDKLGDEFAKACREGQEPRIEDYLSLLPAAARWQGLRKLIAEEVGSRRERGESVTLTEYLARFAEAHTAVSAAFAICDRLLDSTVDKSRPGEESVGEQPAPDITPPTPEQIGGYVVRRKLGGGTFGVVHLAYDESLDREVALKLPRMDRFTSQEQIDRFLAEARIAARLDHPGIVRIHHILRDDGICIVQEYVPGGNLASPIQARAFHDNPQRLVDLMIQIAEALAHAHEHGVFHRDLKPANILLDTQGHPRIVDFGLALRDTDQLTRRGERSGTPAYMSPEQARGEAHRVDERSDIWSLGVILYEALTGRRPFRGRSFSELYEEIEQHDPRPLRALNRAVSPELERICLKCLQRRMADRYALAADLADDLRRLAQPGAASAAQVPQLDLDGSVASHENRSTGPVPSGAEYYCYVSHSKVDQLYAQLPESGLRAGAIPTPEQLQSSSDTPYGRPDVLQRNLTLKREYARRLAAVMAHLAPQVATFAWPAASGDALFYAYRGQFRVAEIDSDQLMASLRTEHEQMSLTLHCSLRYFSQEAVKDGRVFIHSMNFGFFHGQPATFDTVFVLGSRVADRFYGSPLFLKLSAGDQLGI